MLCRREQGIHATAARAGQDSGLCRLPLRAPPSSAVTAALSAIAQGAPCKEQGAWVAPQQRAALVAAIAWRRVGLEGSKVRRAASAARWPACRCSFLPTCPRVRCHLAAPQPAPPCPPELLHNLLEVWPLLLCLCPALLHQRNVAVQAAKLHGVGAWQRLARRDVQASARQHVGHQVPGVGGAEGQLPRQQLVQHNPGDTVGGRWVRGG